MDAITLTGITLAMIGSLGLGGFITYTFQELKRLKLTADASTKVIQGAVKFISAVKIPTPEDVAKEVMKVKIPLNEMPPELMEQIKQAQAQVADKDAAKTYMG